MLQKMKLPNGEELRAGVTKLERYKNGIPIYGSLADTRMGTNNFHFSCKTCDCTYAGSGSKMDDMTPLELSSWNGKWPEEKVRRAGRADLDA